MPMPRSSGALLVGDSTPLFCSFMSEVHLSSNTIAESTEASTMVLGGGWMCGNCVEKMWQKFRQWNLFSGIAFVW
jgi:hypothetical protein